VTPAEDLAREHYDTQQQLNRTVGEQLSVLWGTVPAADPFAGWEQIAKKAIELVALAQFLAALGSLGYVGEAVRSQGSTPNPLADLDPRAFAGTAADGRSLETLLRGAAARTAALTASGAPPTEALRSGQAKLVMYGVNEVTQAGSSAAAAQVAITPAARGFRRVLRLPSCGRCMVLAGKWFEWNEGFLRHPLCDCIHLPTTELDGIPTASLSPSAAFQSLTEEQQNKTVGKAAAEAIREGADIGRVVNARLSMTIPKGYRGWRGTPTTRTVEDCLTMSGGDRDKFARLLDESGYIRGGSRVRLGSAPEAAAATRAPGAGITVREPAPAMPPRITVNLDGIEPRVAAEAMDELARLCAEYPEAAAQIDFVGSSANAKKLWSVKGFGGKTETYAWTLRPQADRGSPIAIATNVKGMSTYEEWAAKLDSQVAAGWLNPGSGTVRGIVSHEFGHQVFFAATRTPAMTRAWEEGVAARLGLSRSDHAAFNRALAKGQSEIGRYASQNADERFAEAFSAVRFDPDAPEFARILVEEALKVIRGAA
jgi:hypothetical protein